MSIVDIVIIALVAMFIVFGVWKGLQRTSLGLGAFLIAFIIAFFLAKVVAEALLNVDGIRKFVLGGDGWSLYTWIRNGFGDWLGDWQPSQYLTNKFFEPIVKIIAPYSGYTEVFTVNDGLALYCAFLMFSAVVGVGVFIIARLLLCIATMIIKSFIPRKKTAANRAFGGLVGVARGFVWSMVLTLIFTTMGGMTFVSGFNKIETEYEQSVIAQKVYDWSYAIRNKIYLPNADMYARIIEKSGFTLVEEKPPEDELFGDRLEIYNYLLNLNYISGSPYGIDPITGDPTFDETDCVKIDPEMYSGTGFGDILRGFMEYNEQAAESIGQGALDGSDSGALLRYKELLWESTNSVYNIYFVASTTDDMLFTDLYNYTLMIEEYSATATEETVAEYNRRIGVLHDKIVDKFDAVKTLYSELGPVFGTIEFELPDAVVISLGSPEPAPEPTPEPAPEPAPEV